MSPRWPAEGGKQWVGFRGGSHHLGGATCTCTPLGRAQSRGHCSVCGIVSAAPSPRGAAPSPRGARRLRDGQPSVSYRIRVSRGQVPPSKALAVGPALGNADSRPTRCGSLQSLSAMLSPCALVFFSPQISQTAPVQGGTAHLPEPRKSSSMARL